MHVYVHMCLNIQMYIEAKSQHLVSSLIASPPYFLKQDVSPNLEMASAVRLAG